MYKKCLRIFRIDSNHAAGARQECLLNNNKEKDFCAPLTSFDWSEVDQKLIGTSSIDTTCTIWEVETGAPLARVPRSGFQNYKLAVKIEV